MQLGKQKEELEATALLECWDILPSLKSFGMIPMTGVWLLVATSCSERTGKEGGEGLLPSTSVKENNVKSCP